MIWREIIRAIEGTTPEIWNRFRPPVFKGVEGFHDYRIPAITYASLESLHVQRPSDPWLKTHEAERDAVFCWFGSQHNFPLFFLEKGLLDALAHTELNETVDWESMHFPYPSLTVVMPRGGLCLEYGELAILRACRVDKGRSAYPGTAPVEQSLLLIHYFLASAEGLDQTLYDPWVPVRLRGQDDNRQESLETRTKDVLNRILFNLLYVMAARPEYVETGRKLGIQRRSSQEIWTPNRIGQKYVVKRSAEATRGTHASPRMHWRRGHFRHQPFGTELKQSKVIWIEPTLING